MRFFCPACGTPHVKPNKEIAQTGSKVDCTQCGFSIRIMTPKRKKALGVPSGPSTIKNRTPEVDRSNNAWNDHESNFAELDDEERVEDECRTVEFVADKQYLSSERKEPAREKTEKEAQDSSETKESFSGSEVLEPTLESKKVTQSADSIIADAKPPLQPLHIAAHKKMFGPRSGQYRFRDLIYALQVPFDYRKTLIVASGFFVGFLLLTALLFLAGKTQSTFALRLGGLIGMLAFSICFFASAGTSTLLTVRELGMGRRLPVKEGYVRLRANLFVVIGFPLAMLVILALLGSAIGLFLLIARIPYVGPLVYGLTFGGTLLLGVLIVLVTVVAFCLIYSYIPVCEGHGVWGLTKQMWQLIQIDPFRYALHLAVTVGIATVLMMMVGFVYTKALAVIFVVDGWVGGGELGGMLAAGPSSFLLGFKNYLGSLSNLSPPVAHGDWPLRIAGWMAATFLLASISVAVGFIWTYFSAAGVINVHLIMQEEK